jgi:membrane protease YdiL (CAAX protease family)
VSRIFNSLPFRFIWIGLAVVGASVGLGRLADLWGSNGAIIGLGTAQLLLLMFETNAHAFGLPIPQWRGKIIWGVIIGLLTSIILFGLEELWVSGMSWLGLDVVEQPMVSVLRTLSGANLATLIIMTGLVGPIVEEIYFRFWWLDWLRKRTTAVEAGLLVSLFFAFLHGGTSLFPGLFLFGCVCTFARLRWGLLAAIACHSTFNLVTIIAVRGGWF